MYVRTYQLGLAGAEGLGELPAAEAHAHAAQRLADAPLGDDLALRVCLLVCACVMALSFLLRSGVMFSSLPTPHLVMTSPCVFVCLFVCALWRYGVNVFPYCVMALSFYLQRRGAPRRVHTAQPIEIMCWFVCLCVRAVWC
jgi:hypothetical protein